MEIEPSWYCLHRANDPSLVLADEPTGNLDQKNAEGIFELLIKLNKEKQTAFLVVFQVL